MDLAPPSLPRIRSVFISYGGNFSWPYITVMVLNLTDLMVLTLNHHAHTLVRVLTLY